jgi:hypothetical protein
MQDRIVFEENAPAASPPSPAAIPGDPESTGKELTMKTFVIGLLAAGSLAAALPAAAETTVVKHGPAGVTVVRKIGPNRTVIIRRHGAKTVEIVKIRHHRHMAATPQARS